MKKVLLVVVLGVVAVIGLAITYFGLQLNNVKKAAAAEYSNMTDVDLSLIPDGVYNGKFGSAPVSVNLEVSVKNHRIENVSIKEQSSGKGYEANEITQKIVNAQKPKVDVVTGATLSSRCIMVAAHRALKGIGN